MTTIYNYSPFTGEFISSSPPIYSPLEKDVILIPAYATTIEPPEVSVGTVPIFKDGEWTVADDFRGVTYWLPDLSQHVQVTIGPLPTGASRNPPENHIGETYWLSDGSEHKVIALGPLPEGALLTCPPLNRSQTLALYQVAAHKNIDDVAISWGYDSILSAVSYASSTNAQYKADAEALITWRDSVWSEAYTIEQGELPKTAEEFVAMLPTPPNKPIV